MIMCVEMINLRTAMEIIVMMVMKEVRFHIGSDKMNRQKVLVLGLIFHISWFKSW